MSAATRRGCGPAAPPGRSRRRRRRLGVAAVGQGRARADAGLRPGAPRGGRLGKPTCACPGRRQRWASGSLAGGDRPGREWRLLARRRLRPGCRLRPWLRRWRPGRLLGDRRGGRLQRARSRLGGGASAGRLRPRARSRRTWPPRWRRSRPRSRPARRAAGCLPRRRLASPARVQAAPPGRRRAPAWRWLPPSAAGCGHVRRPGCPRPTAAGPARRRTMPARRRLQAPARRLAARQTVQASASARGGRRSRRRRLGRRLQPRLGIGPLQGADGLLEGHAERLQQAGRRVLPSPTTAASTMAPSICRRRDCWAADAAACSTRSSSASGRGSRHASPRMSSSSRPR